MPGKSYPNGTTAVIRIQHARQGGPEAVEAAERRAVEFFLETGIHYAPAPGNSDPDRVVTDFWVLGWVPIERIRDLLVGYFLEFTPTGPWWIHVRAPFYPE